MNRISRFVLWICSKFTRAEIERIVKDLQDILKNRNPEIKPKTDFKEKHPNYREFSVNPNPPLKESLKKIKNKLQRASQTISEEPSQASEAC
ncbi:MAG: hypothetical protein ABH869_08455 [Candidatus Omnitrophota bacterium]